MMQARCVHVHDERFKGERITTGTYAYVSIPRSTALCDRLSFFLVLAPWVDNSPGLLLWTTAGFLFALLCGSSSSRGDRQASWAVVGIADALDRPRKGMMQAGSVHVHDARFKGQRITTRTYANVSFDTRPTANALCDRVIRRVIQIFFA